MATARHHARINAPADEVWKVVRDPAGITDWLPGIDGVEMEGATRIVSTLGVEIREDCIVNDDLRRFQYTITESPLNTTYYLSTIDVLEVDGLDGCVVVYSVGVEPGEAVGILDGVLAAGVAALAARFA